MKLNWMTSAALMSLGLMVFAFNNCTPSHKAVGTANSQSTTFECSESLDEMLVFSRTYAPFLQNNCAACHAGQGPGPGAFANSGLLIAYNSFSPLGFSTINTKALDGHSPTSGPQNQGTMDSLAQSYVDGLQQIEYCKSIGAGGGTSEVQDGADRVRTVSKGIDPNLTGAKKTITWNLNTELIANPQNVVLPADMINATISVDVEIFQRPGLVSWVISRPTIHTTTNDIHIESILVRINGKSSKSQRAFYLVNTDIRAWNASHPYFGDNSKIASNDLVQDGALVISGQVRITDVISLSIGKISKTTLPPLDLGPKVRFAAASASNAESGTVDITVQLDKPTTELTSLEVEFGPETTVRDECCVAILNDAGDPIEPKNFDRDFNTTLGTRQNYTVGTSIGRWYVGFNSGEVSKTIRVQIVPDTRDEIDEVLHLKFANLNKLRADTTNQEYRLTIVDNDAPHAGPERTFSQLMNPGGVLNQYCIRCHNSIDFRGGYDMTDYQQMLDEGILIPGDVNSIMYLRMNANLPGLDPMPLNGLITDITRRRQVEDWIRAGAANN